MQEYVEILEDTLALCILYIDEANRHTNVSFDFNRENIDYKSLEIDYSDCLDRAYDCIYRLILKKINHANGINKKRELGLTFLPASDSIGRIEALIYIIKYNINRANRILEYGAY